MRVPVPHNDSLPLVSIILFTPKGEVTVTVDDSHYWVDIPLPEGVQEDEVDVYSCFLGPDHRPPFGCGPALLRAAKRKRPTRLLRTSGRSAPADETARRWRVSLRTAARLRPDDPPGRRAATRPPADATARRDAGRSSATAAG